jgi:hypothetical protein
VGKKHSPAPGARALVRKDLRGRPDTASVAYCRAIGNPIGCSQADSCPFGGGPSPLESDSLSQFHGFDIDDQRSRELARSVPISWLRCLPDVVFTAKAKRFIARGGIVANEANTTVATGQEAVSRLLKDVDTAKLDWNEADTRAQIIDRVIVECLGWDNRQISREKPQGREYTDYELGSPRKVIWEAKRQGKVFDLPATSIPKPLRDLPSILAIGGEAKEAVEQVQGYCASRGVEIAVATNGHQIIAFLATRTDGTPPLAGKCLVIDGYVQLVAQFPLLWQMLSPSGIAERRLNRYLHHGDDRAIPSKLAIDIPSYRQPRYPSMLQESLRTVAELLLVDAAESDVTEKRFYEECYCPSGALSRHALLSKNILSERYASLFDG